MTYQNTDTHDTLKNNYINLFSHTLPKVYALYNKSHKSV